MKHTKSFKMLLMAALIAVSGSVFAQVKIGTNPTTIGSNSNLEVEASNSKKVIVHKSDGTMVIENTPSGAITDSLVTVDAAGNVRMKSVASLKTLTQLNPYFKTTGSVSKNTAEPSTLTYVQNQTVTLNNDILYTPATGEMTANKAGIYFFAVTSTGPANLGSGAIQNDHCTYFFVNGTSNQQICGRSANFAPTATNTGIVSLSVGDKMRVGLTTASNVVTTGSYSFIINVFKLSEKL